MMRRNFLVFCRRLNHAEVKATAAVYEWARANPEIAGPALRPPPLPARESRAIETADSIESFAVARGYDLPTIDKDRSYAIRLLSGALSYPLTLAKYAKQLGAKDGPTRVAVLGARAESTLPMAAWAEVSALYPTEWKILLLGTQVVPTRRLVETQTIGRVSVTCRRSSLVAEDDLNGIFAEAFDDDEGDLLVTLFNPGLGHPNHRESWREAAKAIERANPRGVLVTSFSQRDAASDLSGLDHLFPPSSVKWIVRPELNSFGSAIHVLDPVDHDHVTAANERAFMVKLSAATVS